MKISYAITVCDEFLEIQRLLTFLLENKRIQDEVVVLIDLSKNEPTSELLGYLHRLSSSNYITLQENYFSGHFADWKNSLATSCKGDYIFQIDADEMPNELLIEHLPYILEENSQADIILVPRINTVEGLTQEHIQKWGWNVNEHNWINYPDYQWRIYRNCPEVKWINKVHERLDGFKVYATLPDTGEYHLTHPKTIDKQERQNNYYNTL